MVHGMSVQTPPHRYRERLNRTGALITSAGLVASAFALGGIVVQSAPAQAATSAQGDPTTVWVEDFENVSSPVVGLEDYVAEDSGTYTASKYWLRHDQCNGVVVSYDSLLPIENAPYTSGSNAGLDWGVANFPDGFCNIGGTAGNYPQLNVRRMADVLGQLQDGSIGGTSVSPTNASNSSSQANHVVTAWTQQALTVSEDETTVFESGQSVYPTDGVPEEGRYYTGSLDVAETSCDYQDGANTSKLSFMLFSGDREVVLNNSPVEACKSADFGYFTSPMPANLPETGAADTTNAGKTNWGNAGTYVGASRVYGDKASLLTSDELKGLKLRITNETLTGAGNDFAFDNAALKDVTPTLNKEFSPATITQGGESTLTFTIANTSENGEKAGWTFVDEMPDGLAVADEPEVSTTCLDPTAAEGSSATVTAKGSNVSVNGSLGSGQDNCTVSLKVTSDETGTYTNDPADAEREGLLPGDSAELTVVPRVGLNIEKTASIANYEPGDEVVYTLDVTNAASTADIPISTAVDARVTDPIPSTVTGASWTCEASDGASCSGGSGSAIDDTVTIPAGGKIVYTVTGKIADDATGTIINTATVTPPPNTTDENCQEGCESTAEVLDPPAADPDKVKVDQGETATLKPETTVGSGDLTSVTFDNGETTKTVAGEGTWKIELKDGKVVATFTPEDGFTGPVTQQKYTVTDENKLTATSTLDVTILPAANPNKVTVDQGETATLNPVTKAGSVDLASVAFDNGETTKTVAGEGTWKIELKDGQVVATFTPDADFTGPVTQQTYTVTDKDGETASSTLDVIIRPATEDASEVINPNETATLKPETTPGSGAITEIAFDNGETTKTVAGEGTWTIELVDGQPVATFTPEKDYHGDVTTQVYTVTDENGETAEGKLSVEINDPPQAEDQEKVIKPNETANLTPETTPGNSDITKVTFDNGETTKTVAGEGTWTIELKDGEVVATFTPETDYDGAVTSQDYTITDKNGLTATAQLGITIINPALTLEKGYEIVADTNKNGINDPGDVIRWTFHVTNTGNVTLNDVTVDDPTLKDLNVGITCDPTSVDAKASTDCVSGEYTITDADAKAGSIKNVATSTGKVPENTPGDPEDPTSPPDEVEVPIKGTPVPAIDLVKGYKIVTDTNNNGINDTGDVIKWTFDVTNTGNVTLEDVSVNDPKLDSLGIDVTCDTAALLPGLSTTCESANYTITDEDVAAGSIKNVATATGKVPGDTPGNPEDPTSPESEVEVPTDPTPAPSLDLVKQATLHDTNGNGKADKGEKINYSFVVTNTGNVTLNDVAVNDPMLAGLGIGVTCVPSTIAPADETTCTADKAYTVTAQDVKNGKVHNVATATGEVPEGTPGNPDNPVSPEAEVEVPTGSVPSKDLPFTGAQGVLAAGAVGLILVVAGSTLTVAGRKRED